MLNQTDAICKGAIQGPIQQALVSTEIITIMTCDDSPVWDFTKLCNPLRLENVIAYDPEPASLAQTPQNLVVQQVIADLANVNELHPQEYLWHVSMRWSSYLRCGRLLMSVDT